MIVLIKLSLDLDHLIKEAVEKKFSYGTVKISLDKDPLNFFLQNNETTKIFWQNKDSSESIMAFSKLRSFRSIDELRKSIQFLKENKDLLVIGNLNYELNKNDSFCEYIIPKYHFEYSNQGIALCFHIDNENINDISLIKDELLTLIDQYASSKKHIVRTTPPFELVKNRPDKTTWKKNIESALSDINLKKYQKIVLAKTISYKTSNEFNPQDFFIEINNNLNTNSNYLYYSQNNDHHFYSLSPETLFKTEGNSITIDIIAGTEARGKTEKEDDQLINKLKNSQKDRHEHQLVKDDIKNTLEPLCDSINITKDFEILSLKNVHHLHGEIKGQLKKDHSLVTLLECLHPTPAVGGFPKDNIIKYQKQYEGFDRGPYAAPFGVIRHEKSDFGVGIRSAVYHEEEMIFYAGCGIVDGSDPEKEWHETEHKYKLLLLGS